MTNRKARREKTKTLSNLVSNLRWARHQLKETDDHCNGKCCPDHQRLIETAYDYIASEDELLVKFREQIAKHFEEVNAHSSAEFVRSMSIPEMGEY